MALDAYTAAILRLMESAFPDLGGAVDDPGQARRIYAKALFPSGPDVASVRDATVPGTAGVRVRVYRPHAVGGPLPVVVYFHGGGWVLCGLDTHDGVCRLIARETPAVVVSVDYRLAPEHRFPAAVEDAFAAVYWVAGQAPLWGADPLRLAVAGDSAGGALAAAACLRARDVGIPPIAYQLLIYPVTDCLADREGHLPDSLLTARHMRWFVAQYLADRADGENPYASPLRAPDLSGLPPGLVLTAEHDPLRVEGEAYGARLARCGVPVRTHRVDGLFHGLFGLGTLVPVARGAENIALAALRAGLAAHRESAILNIPYPVAAGEIGSPEHHVRSN